MVSLDSSLVGLSTRRYRAESRLVSEKYNATTSYLGAVVCKLY
jgi:hypothetical protein